MQFDWSAIWPAIPILLEGAKMTLWDFRPRPGWRPDNRPRRRFRPLLWRLDC
ncbi:Glutamine transport system permease protein glnP [Raoultella planticola]|uniref:Glutamine transport system permease protein glnP n=1 Tax=Raoultella planticola TaxID=575 RepID=A0A485ASI0_RAOPL|nr:Glutamine transport system permease protein glnP [Raoultella planticola]